MDVPFDIQITWFMERTFAFPVSMNVVLAGVVSVPVV